ncbi:hypothetical protein HRbin24_01405 [bacterium HR24]|jgi:transcription initiation factor TFIIIB Brf1 subunit/transcription initiation factor TFIIB|nr:hypothetical protein HRbin24_01405 [bacterium HR24]
MVTTTKPKVCPRCRGSLVFEEDWYGAYASCLMCGYVYEVGAIPVEEIERELAGDGRQRRRQPSHGKLRL